MREFIRSYKWSFAIGMVLQVVAMNSVNGIRTSIGGEALVLPAVLLLHAFAKEIIDEMRYYWHLHDEEEEM